MYKKTIKKLDYISSTTLEGQNNISCNNISSQDVSH